MTEMLKVLSAAGVQRWGSSGGELLRAGGSRTIFRALNNAPRRVDDFITDENMSGRVSNLLFLLVVPCWGSKDIRR